MVLIHDIVEIDAGDTFIMILKEMKVSLNGRKKPL
jgi:hypothetical protein